MRYHFPTSSPYSSERRGLKRFRLKLPAKVEVLAPGEKQVFNLITSNVSACGAYFHTLSPIPEDTPVRVTITLANEFIRQMTGFESKLTMEGQVVRSGLTGMGIRFNEVEEIERIRIS